MITVVVAASAACQLAAATRALALIRTTGRRVSWALLSAAFLLMAVRRLMSLSSLGTGAEGRLPFELVGLAASVAVLVGTWRIGGYFEQIQAAGEAARRSEARYRSLMRQSSDAIFVFDPATLAIRDANIRFLAMVGCREDELATRTLLDFVDAPEAGIRANVARVVREGTVLVGERAYRRADGSRVWVDVSASRVLTAEGFVVLVNLRDVTDRKREAALLSLLHDVDRKVIAGEHLEQVLTFACEEVVSRIGVAVTVVCGTGAQGVHRLYALAGPASGILGEVLWERCPCMSRLLLNGGDSGRLIGRDDLPPAVREIWSREGLEEGIAFPIAVGDRQAVFSVVSRRVGDLSPLTTVLGRVADEVAVTILESIHREREEVRTAALEAAANAVLILDEEGLVEWVNGEFETLTGWPRDEVVGLPAQILESAAHPAYYYAQLWQTIRSGQVWRGEHFARRKDGSIYPEFQTITPVLRPDGSIRSFIAIKQDVTVERKVGASEAKDSLTGLPRRIIVEGVVERLVGRARRGVPSALLVLDVDHFKAVNDAAGRVEGDNVLRAVSRILEAELRPGDQLFRLGGDEFAIALEGLSPREARATGERLCRVVSDHRFEAGQRVFQLGLSAGLAAIDGAADRDVVLAIGDAALHLAKERGRGRLVAGDETLLKNSAIANASSWAARVKDALRSDGLVLHLQPVLRLSDRGVEHYEALVRMRNGPGSLITPGEFLPAAERFGLMPELDTWVLRRSVELLRGRPDLRLLLNVSGLSLGEPGCLEEIEGILRASRLEPGQVSFEITETAAVGDVLSVRAWLRRLKDLGCRFALDDFGIGFSSFSTLQSLPVDFVKIDGSFVRTVDRDASSRAIVQAIVSISHALGKETVAEAVETKSVAAAVAALGVEMGQGYFLGAPRDAVEVVRELDRPHGSFERGTEAGAFVPEGGVQ